MQATAHLRPVDLSRRWGVSERTLEAWRWQKKGPTYLKIMGRIVYPLNDVRAFEKAGRQIGGTERRA